MIRHHFSITKLLARLIFASCPCDDTGARRSTLDEDTDAALDGLK